MKAEERATRSSPYCVYLPHDNVFKDTSTSFEQVFSKNFHVATAIGSDVKPFTIDQGMVAWDDDTNKFWIVAKSAADGTIDYWKLLFNKIRPGVVFIYFTFTPPESFRLTQKAPCKSNQDVV